jgi:uncharacterized NAD-dependent epimerase/dehydratase family protein
VPGTVKRYLILAEGRSDDAHYGKTMRGVVRYAAEPTVAIVDSERVGETYEGIPIVGRVADALAHEPTTALVGVATQGGRFPPAWRELLQDCVTAGLDVETACTNNFRTTRSCSRSPTGTASRSGTSGSRRPD